MRRYRWQSVLSFALQHLQHSRVLEGQRNASMAFTEQDQVHLLQWYHYQIMRSIKKLEEGRWSSLMHEVSDEQRDMLRQDRDELLALLAQYGLYGGGVAATSVSTCGVGVGESYCDAA